MLFLKPKESLRSWDLRVKIEGVDEGHFSDEPSQRRHYKRDFLAPEVLCGHKFSQKSDIWSLGCVFFQAIRGSPLIDSSDEKNYKMEISAPSQAQTEGPSQQQRQIILKKGRRGKGRARQALLLHCKVSSLPPSFWESPGLVQFRDLPISELIRSRKMEREVLQNVIPEHIRRMDDLELQELIKNKIFLGETLGTFIKTVSFLNQIFYRPIWRVSSKAEYLGLGKDFFEQKVLRATLTVDVAGRFSSKEILQLMVPSFEFMCIPL